MFTIWLYFYLQEGVEAETKKYMYMQVFFFNTSLNYMYIDNFLL